MGLLQKSLAEIIFGSKRGLSLLGAGALYGIGNKALDYQKEFLTAYTGERQFNENYAKGQEAARTALTAGSLYLGVMGGILGKNPLAPVKWGAKAALKTAASPYFIAKGARNRAVYRSLASIGRTESSALYFGEKLGRARGMRQGAIDRLQRRTYGRSGLLGGKPAQLPKASMNMLRKMAPKSPWTYAGIGTFAVGMSAGISFTPSYKGAIEGRITSLSTNAPGRLNYSTAGLTQSLYNRRRG